MLNTHDDTHDPARKTIDGIDTRQGEDLTQSYVRIEHFNRAITGRTRFSLDMHMERVSRMSQVK